MQYSRNRARVGPRLSALPILLLLVLGAAVIAVLYVGGRMLMAPRPVISLAGPFELVGRNAVLAVDVRDPSGLRSLKVTVRQGDKEQTVVEERFQPPRPQAHAEWRPARETRFRLTEGPGTVHVEARNASWGGFFKGRTASFEKTFTARLTPPRLEVLTTQHYVNQGGCDMVVYRVTPPGAESGVQAGEAWFPGYPMPGASDPAVRFALFAYPYDAAPGTPVRLEAHDEAGNTSLTSFNLRVFPKTFRSRPLPLSDAFLQKVVPEILSQTPTVQDQGDLLKTFLVINRDLRKADNKVIVDLSRRSQPRLLWTEAFRQGASQVEASFADHRTYVYQGREVDRQDHLGYDLATTSHAPVAAANDGVVLLAEYLGIYGNTIVLDHGYGLLTLYGHLAGFSVKAGDKVQRGQVMAQSDSTGLAGGDHVHFSVILQGQQVDAREWWDPHWIEDRVMSKLREFGKGAAPAPSAPAAAAPARPPAPGRHHVAASPRPRHKR